MSDEKPALDDPTAHMSRAPNTGQPEASMIASNIDPNHRTAPDVAKTSIIDDIYAFAARLREGSTGT